MSIQAHRRGFVAIGVSHAKTTQNVGTLWRSAHNFGAAFIFTIGRRYDRQPTDTGKAWRHTPLFHFASLEDLVAHLPLSCPLIGVELDDCSLSLSQFMHPERACYLLGAEDHGLTSRERSVCHKLVVIPGFSRCLNVASAGSIVLYDRAAKEIAHGRARLAS